MSDGEGAAVAEAKKQADDEAAATKNADDAATKKKADDEAATKKKADEDAVTKKNADDDATKKKADDEAAAKKNDDDAAIKKKADDEASAKKNADDAATKKKADDEAAAKKKADDEAATKKNADDAATKKKADDEAASKKKADDAAAAKKKADDAAAKKKERALVPASPRDGGAVWRDGKVVSCSEALAHRKQPAAALNTAAHGGAGDAAPLSPSKKVSGTSPRLLAKPPVPHDMCPHERHPLTQDRMTEVNEHLFYGPIKAEMIRLKELDNKYLGPTETKKKAANRVVAEDVANRMYTVSVEKNKCTHDALMKKYVEDPSVKILTPEEGTLLIQRVYTSSMEKQRELYEGLLEKYVPKREFKKLSMADLVLSATRLSAKK